MENIKIYQTIMECFLCLEIKKDKVDCIKLRSSTWDELKVETIIEKHLWPIAMFKTDSLWLCMTCWNVLHEFHNYYKRIEEAHVNYERLMKSEADTLLNAEENKSKDFCLENLTEPEIELDHESIASVKEENEEYDNDFYYNDEDDIPLIHISGKGIDRFLEDPINNKKEAMEDPLNKATKCKSNKSKRKKPKKYSNEENVSLNQKPVEEIENNERSIKCDSENSVQNSADKSSSSSLIIAVNERKSNLTYFYQSSISCREYDKFIIEHFKLTCHICQQSLDTFSELQTHFRETHEHRGYVICCDTKFYDRSSLVDHINCHFNPEYFKCKYCSKVLTLRKSFKVHMKSHDKSHSCDICDKKFQRKCFLNYHKQTHLSKEEKKIPCTDCDKFFASKYLLTNHQRVIHLKKYAKLCNICGQSLLNLESFKRHMKKHDGNTGPALSCDICGLLVSSERYLKAHMKIKHPVGGNSEKVCHICQKVLQGSVGLRHHIRRNHNTGYIHKCSVCEKAFKRIDHLKAHMNIHTGADKSKCPWCPRTFNANSSMHHHRKNVHPKEWEEARRKKYSGKLPPDFKPTETNEFATTAHQELDYSSIQSRLIF